MRLRELFYITEGYKEAILAFANSADQTKVNDTIEKYKTLVNKNQVQGNERNIDFWIKQGWDSFDTFVKTKIAQPTATQLKKKKIVGKSINLIDNDKWFIVIPLDKNASCFHGKNSDWCTTKLNANHFEHYFYKRDVILIYCTLKSSGQMWAIAGHPGTSELEIFSQTDVPMSASTFTAETGLNPVELVQMAVKQHTPQLTGAKQQYQEYYNYLKDNIPNIQQRDKTIEGMLEYTKDGEMCRKYVDILYSLNIDVQELSQSIIRALVGYNPEYLEYFPNAQEPVHIDAVMSGAKALKYISKPSDKVLDVALSNHLDALRYINDDNIISNAVYKYPKAAAYQAVNVFQDRLTGLEDLIATDTMAASYYLKIMDEPWPKAEKAILKNEVAIPMYVKNNMQGKKWPEGEKALLHMGDPYYMYEYATATHDRFEEAEPKIIKDVVTAASYAIEVLQDRWPDIEDELLEISPEDYDSPKEYATEFGWDTYKQKWSKFFPEMDDDDADEYSPYYRPGRNNFRQYEDD